MRIPGVQSQQGLTKKLTLTPLLSSRLKPEMKNAQKIINCRRKSFSGLCPAHTFAADLPVEPLVEECDLPWNCFYGGINGGYAWTNRFGTTSIDISSSLSDDISFERRRSAHGLSVGVQASYNNRFSEDLLAGLEADLNYVALGLRESVDTSFLNSTEAFVFANVRLRHRIDWFGTLRGRLGFLAGEDFLLYGTGGLAFGHVKSSVTVSADLSNGMSGSFGDSDSGIHWGWTVGGGLEFKISDEWTFKGEYLYVNLENTDYALTQSALQQNLFADVLVGFSGKNDFNLVRVGLNYHF